MTHPHDSHARNVPPDRLHPDLAVGEVALSVSDLRRSVAFYGQVLGMQVLQQAPGEAVLGVGARALLALTEVPGAPPAPAGSPGLFHFALLLPSRAHLARWVRHAADLGARVGQSDHLVSEAFYLTDPDGHGIEVYRDRPRDAWRWTDGQVRMASDPIDIPGLLAEPGSDAPFEGLPAGTVMGHVHLRVADLAASKAFYQGVLGFDVVARWPGALFVSAGGYHHHLGLNTWQSQNGRPAPERSAALQRVHLILPDGSELDRLARRLSQAQVSHTRDQNHLDVRDPAGNTLRFTT